MSAKGKNLYDIMIKRAQETYENKIDRLSVPMDRSSRSNLGGRSQHEEASPSKNIVSPEFSKAIENPQVTYNGESMNICPEPGFMQTDITEKIQTAIKAAGRID